MKILRKKVVYKGKFVCVTNNYFINARGHKGVWQVVSRPNSGKIVIIFALTPEREMLLIKQYRIPAGSFVIERPAGLTDIVGESYEDAARRELLEETGYASEKMIKVYEGPFNAGISADQAVLFFAPDAKWVKPQELDLSEDIEVLKVPLEEVVELMLNPPADCLVDIKLLDVLPILQHMKLL